MSNNNSFPNEYRIQRDSLQFPRALPSNTGMPINSNEFNFNDRNGVSTRKDRYQPVQNGYIQNYRMEQIQGQFNGYYDQKQNEINRIMDEPKLESTQKQLQRNFEDAQLFQRNMPPIFSQNSFGEDTRKQHTQVQIENNMSRTLPQGEFGQSFDYNNMNIDRMQYQNKK